MRTRWLGSAECRLGHAMAPGVSVGVDGRPSARSAFSDSSDFGPATSRCWLLGGPEDVSYCGVLWRGAVNGQDVRLEALTFRQLETAEGKHGVKHVVQHGHDRTENL